MAKILTDKEMIDIVRRAPNEIEDSDAYRRFLEELGNLIANHFGGERGTVTENPDDGLEYTCAFRINEKVPEDGGIYKEYDRDVIWIEGKEND